MTTSAKMMKTRTLKMNLKKSSHMIALAIQQSLLMTSLRTTVRLIKKRLILKTMRKANIRFSKNAPLLKDTLKIIQKIVKQT